ncbi:hypothetical protein CTAYLR_010326 [Chrysophaeum taylorii]|uniref:Ankyrin repeat protein n=1 Tax=Chrysophaeum taylorii TaxID=2483200 RepID=A0AAD7UL52_9STRA|nr:hypothetical protein CTAYLR_010326 [Chrysophaeum taylorii]
MKALVMLNAVEDDELEDKRAMLREMVDAREEWLLGLLDGVSEEALQAIVRKRITDQSLLVEISKLFDKVGVENHVDELLKLMVPGYHYDPAIDENVELPRGSSKKFVEVGAINWISWFLRQRAHLRRCLCHVAARAGQLEVLQWARDNDCRWDARTCSEAARGGHFEVLEWARASGCPWDERTCSAAARNGHLTLLKWARANGCPWKKADCLAAASDRPEVLAWTRDQLG